MKGDCEKRRREEAKGGEKGNIENRHMEIKGRKELEVEKESRGRALKKGMRGVGEGGGAEKD